MKQVLDEIAMTGDKVKTIGEQMDHFANRVFDALDAATAQAEFGLAEMAANKLAIRQLTNWP